MAWIIAEALLALALLVGVIVWVALPAQRTRRVPPRSTGTGEAPSPAATATADAQKKSPPDSGEENEEKK